MFLHAPVGESIRNRINVCPSIGPSIGWEMNEKNGKSFDKFQFIGVTNRYKGLKDESAIGTSRVRAIISLNPKHSRNVSLPG